MALYTIGDLHLSLGADKPMDVFGSNWENHTEKLREGFSGLTDEDLCVICGDLSWGIDLEGSKEDFRFISSLPGKKIILKGNHDYWWSTAAKAYRFFAENGMEGISVLNNNCYFYEDIAICGTRGWFYEEESGGDHDKKIMLRELGRLETSLKAAGDKEKYVFLHYPPIFAAYRCEGILELFETYGVKKCFYGHIHGKGRGAAFEREHHGTSYRLISADHLNFAPYRVL